MFESDLAYCKLSWSCLFHHKAEPNWNYLSSLSDVAEMHSIAARREGQSLNRSILPKWKLQFSLGMLQFFGYANEVCKGKKRLEKSNANKLSRYKCVWALHGKNLRCSCLWISFTHVVSLIFVAEYFIFSDLEYSVQAASAANVLPDTMDFMSMKASSGAMKEAAKGSHFVD